MTLDLHPDFDHFDPATVREEAEGGFARRMLHIYRAFNALAQQKYAQRGYAGLTPAHTSLMANLNPDGIRVVDLADRMGITKQFAGRLVQSLLKLEFVTTQADPTDRRAMLVKGTRIGWQFLIDACVVREEIESIFKAALGDTHYQAFSGAIEKLATLNVDTSGAPEPIELVGGNDD
jgi:DNA-binding MarR family transcriptional regulator